VPPSPPSIVTTSGPPPLRPIAAPLTFTDHVALPFRIGFSRVYRTFAEHGLHERMYFVGSGKLGFPDAALLALALGCDSVAVGREAMLAIGCIQAQECHTGHCPTGVATQSRWLVRGLDPTSKSARCANYLVALRKELLQLALACGVSHPALVTLDHLELLDGRGASMSARHAFGYDAQWGGPSTAERAAVSAPPA
jgi:glutamate synthase domain-containing protein 2